MKQSEIKAYLEAEGWKFEQRAERVMELFGLFWMAKQLLTFSGTQNPSLKTIISKQELIQKHVIKYLKRKKESTLIQTLK